MEMSVPPRSVPVMPSFRLELEILGLRPGHAPPEVLATLLGFFDALGHHVDTHDLDIVAGTPRLYVRFAVPDSNDAEEDAVAFLLADAARKATDAVAVPGRLWVLRRRKGAWLPARWHHRSPIADDVRFADEEADAG